MTIPAGFGQVSWFFGGAGTPLGAATTIGFDHNSAATAAELAESFYELFANEALPLLNNQTSLTGCQVKLGPDATGPTGLFSDTNTGSLTGESFPPNVAFLVHKNTNLGGREGRGRMYVPGVAEGVASSNGVLSGGTVSSWNTALGTMLLAAALSDVPFYLLHASATSPTAVQTLTIDSTVATQRRRLRR